MLVELSMWARRVARASVVALVAALLASCGGSTTQVEPFVPQQVIALGDETNLLTVGGKRYSINGLDANGAFDCRLLPVWTQSLAAAWGFVYDRCNPNSVTPTRGVMRAQLDAKSTDLAAQIDAQVALAPPNSKDLFTVVVGMHDVLELYQQYPARTEAELTTELKARGTLVADQVNRVIDLGGRVIVSTIPDLGLTPYALAQESANAGRAALLTRLTDAFNARVRADILQDGRYVGLVLADVMLQLLVRNPGTYGLTNWTQAACTTPLPECTTATLVPGATAVSHLWADETRIGPVAHSQLYQMAISRASRAPF